MKGKTGLDEVFSELVAFFCKYELPWEEVVGSMTMHRVGLVKRTVLAEKLKREQRGRCRSFEFSHSWVCKIIGRKRN
jgi:hypothetical protein